MAAFSGTIPETEKHLVSRIDGCPAPHTLKVVSLPKAEGQAANRSVAIWQGNSGIYISDGRSPIPVHEDIKNYFDENLPECITASMLGKSEAWVDEKRFRYHWKFASGVGQTTLNKELVLDYHEWKWFEVDRGTKSVQCGVAVHDKYGNPYVYGFIETDAVGYLERLEYGQTFDSEDISYEIELGDFFMDDKEPLIETRAEYLNILLVAKEITTKTLTYAHKVDTETSASASFSNSMSKTGYRIKDLVIPINSKVGVFHSGKLSFTCDNEDIALEVLGLGYFYSNERERLREV
jgi:hypothetical protein